MPPINRLEMGETDTALAVRQRVVNQVSGGGLQFRTSPRPDHGDGHLPRLATTCGDGDLGLGPHAPTDLAADPGAAAGTMSRDKACTMPIPETLESRVRLVAPCACRPLILMLAPRCCRFAG